MAKDPCPRCVLLLEDDERLREKIGAFLEAKGYPTSLAEDGEEAFELLKTVDRPCLLLVDLLTLPIDWAKLFAALGPNDRMATLPMVLVTVTAPDLLSRPAVVKRPLDFDILFRMVEQHCCGGRAIGGGDDSSTFDSTLEG
jgi:CheY-like chemotaxis protein